MFTGIIVLITGCQKEDKTGVIDEPQTQELEFAFDVKTVDNMLVIPSTEDYEMAIDYLGNLGDHNFPEWDEQLSFNSMRAELNNEELKQIGFYD